MNGKSSNFGILISLMIVTIIILHLDLIKTDTAYIAQIILVLSLIKD